MARMCIGLREACCVSLGLLPEAAGGYMNAHLWCHILVPVRDKCDETTDNNDKRVQPRLDPVDRCSSREGADDSVDLREKSVTHTYEVQNLCVEVRAHC